MTLSGSTVCLAQTEQVIRYNGGRDDHAYSVVTDGAGAVYVGGVVESSSRPTQFAVVKHNGQGVLEWVAQYQGSAGHTAGAVADLGLDSAGNLYAVGYIARQITFVTYNIDWLVVSFDSHGMQRWAQQRRQLRLLE